MLGSRPLHLLAVFALVAASSGGCGSGGAGGGGGGSTSSGGGGGCPGGQLADAHGSCTPIGIQGCADVFVDADGLCRPASAKCPKGTIAEFSSGCVAVGIPKCDPKFIEADGLCHPTNAKCPSGTFAVPQKGCVAIDGTGCGAGTWGDIPDGAGNVYVDASYAGGDGDGSKAKPVTTVAAAMALVQDGGRVAIAAGEYTEPVVVDKAIELVGRCPSMVTIDGNDGDPQVPTVVLVVTGPSTLRGLRLSGDGVGVYVGSTAGVTLDGLHIDQTAFVGIGAVTAPTAVTLRNSFISGTRGLQQQGGNAISVVDGATLSIVDSALFGNHIAGIAGGNGSSVVATDVLVENTLGQELDGNGGQGFIMSASSTLTLSASAIVASTYVGLEADASTVKASGVLVEGTRPDPTTHAFGGGVDASPGSNVTLDASVVAHNLAVGVFGHGALTRLHVSKSLVFDTRSQESDGAFGVGVIAQDDAIVDVADTTIAKSRELGVDAANHAALGLSRVLVEDTLGRDDDGTWGIGAGVTGGAGLTLDAVAMSGARGAGLLNASGTATITGSLFTGIASGNFTLIGAPMPLTGVGDGVLTTFGGATTFGASRAEDCFRAGILFDSSTGGVTASSSAKNHYGLVLDGMPTPTYDTASSFDDNEQGIVNDAKLPVPNAPAALPE